MAQRGPAEYLEELVHIVPQSLGFARSRPSRAADVGSGFSRLDYVGHMEDLNTAWEHVIRGLGLGAEGKSALRKS